jgi:hypothetical protein
MLELVRPLQTELHLDEVSLVGPPRLEQQVQLLRLLVSRPQLPGHPRPPYPEYPALVRRIQMSGLDSPAHRTAKHLSQELHAMLIVVVVVVNEH